ncbi:hypothetical protein LCGC14_0481670 [marine sediment metagenome]|uniref:Uncharacterized protein n=1 Tax=marine sediment metagenome TaxID=412755 RepID=A0A0F9SSE6_9ZZZZ
MWARFRKYVAALPTAAEVAMAFTLGFVLTIVAVGVLFTVIGAALAQESVRTYPARLGEQDRRLVTEQPDYGTPHHVNQYIVSIIEDDIERTASSKMACRQQNLYLHYLLVDLAKYLGRNPHQGELFKPAIQSIHDAWCRQ